MTDPIIVAGVPHSGTTMTMNILYELGMETSLYNHRPSVHGSRLDYFEIWKLKKMDWDEIDTGEDQPAKEKIIRDTLADIFPDQSGMWGFKLLAIPDRADVWFTLYPNAKIVHVYRASPSKKWGRSDWLEKQNIYEAKLNAALARNPTVQKLRFDYDASLRNKIVEGQKVADFLGVPFTPQKKEWLRNFIISSE